MTGPFIELTRGDGLPCLINLALVEGVAPEDGGGAVLVSSSGAGDWHVKEPFATVSAIVERLVNAAYHPRLTLPEPTFTPKTPPLEDK